MEITIKRYSRKMTYEDAATLDEFWELAKRTERSLDREQRRQHRHYSRCHRPGKPAFGHGHRRSAGPVVPVPFRGADDEYSLHLHHACGLWQAN